jgi:hypothetical protein
MLESAVLICGHCQGLLLHLRITVETPQRWTLISIALGNLQGEDVKDMTLPDGSGLDLLQRLSERRMACRTLVFSGSMDAALYRDLLDRGVWRVLTKPASVGSLLDAVGQALVNLAPVMVVPPCSMPASATDMVNKYFGVNQRLFVAYHQSCLDQFVEDHRMGDHSVQTQDSAGLRRIAHSLNTKSAHFLCWARWAQSGINATPNRQEGG